jgi:hypothetical protein
MPYEEIAPDRITETVVVLSRRIKERFPSAGLNHVCQRLLEIAKRAQLRADEIARPITWVRVLSGFIISLLLVLLAGVIWTATQGEDWKLRPAEVIQVIESGLNELAAIGITVFFLVSLELRLKRRRALQAIHELRVISHIIDMHQLTKDPERIAARSQDTASSPKRTMTDFELNRYLDYCSEMLALVGKIAVLYVQHFPDQQAVSAVNEVENLTSGLSRKIWQKIMVLHSSRSVSEASPSPPSSVVNA